MKFKSPMLKDYVKELLKNDFKVYRTADKDQISYVFFEKDGNIGYVQEGNWGCLDFSTVHKPNRNTGTGYRINEEEVCKPTIKDAESTFISKPHWARDRLEDIQKYRNFDEYKNRETVLKYVEIKKVR